MVVQNVIEFLRRESVEACFSLSAFQSGWANWKSEINRITGGNYNDRSLLLLGDHLSDIFLTTRSGGRGQSQVSGGGYGWEGLVCWYLNLCFSGSRAVAVKKVSDLPSPFIDSISVNYGSFRSNTESDITILIFPNDPLFTSDKSSIVVNDISGNQVPNFKSNGSFNSSPILNRLAEIYFDRFELGIIQCKTNWNDNAQIPMLWSMIYQASFANNSSISIGRNGYSIQQIPFTYSFCTVPTNNLSNYSATSTSVQRVRNLSGGNYWGRPTVNSVSNSLKEIFNRNYQSAFTPSNQRTILNSISGDLSGDLDYFDII